MYESQNITKKSHPKEWALIKRCFANYRKRTALIITTESTMLSGRYWSEGSISRYSVIDPKGNMTIKGNRNDFPFTAPDDEVDLTDGTQVVQVGVFCGKPGQAYLYRSQVPAFAGTMGNPTLDGGK